MEDVADMEVRSVHWPSSRAAGGAALGTEVPFAAPIGAASRSPALARARLTTALTATTTRAPDSARPRGLRIGLTGRRSRSAGGP